MDMKQYQSEAHVTASTSFFGSFVGTQDLLIALNDAIQAIMEVDKIKKQLFYGRNIAPIGPIASVAELNMTEQEQAIFHALIGVGTEGGECLELLRDFIMQCQNHDAESFNFPKVMEELGGAMWYIPIGAQAMDVTMEDIAKLNIGQLRVRYAGKFEAYEANNRNLAAENLRLEELAGGTDAQQAAKIIAESCGQLSASEKGLHIMIDIDHDQMPVLTELGKPTADEEKKRYIERNRHGLK